MGQPGRPVVAQAVQQPEEREDNREEHQLSDFDADIEHQQREPLDRFQDVDFVRVRVCAGSMTCRRAAGVSLPRP
jgi:hypothetical protein